MTPDGTREENGRRWPGSWRRGFLVLPAFAPAALASTIRRWIVPLIWAWSWALAGRRRGVACRRGVALGAGSRRLLSVWLPELVRLRTGAIGFLLRVDQEFSHYRNLLVVLRGDLHFKVILVAELLPRTIFIHRGVCSVESAVQW